jgi:undecaprenyl diphosphate synthase
MFFKKKKKEVVFDNLPTHIAFIMDGNGRWAKKRGMPRTFGHKMGIEAMKKVVQACFDFKIKVVSFFAFSTENWKRPKDEVDYIFKLAGDYVDDICKQYKSEGIKIVTMGDLSRLPELTQNQIKKATEETKNGTKLIVNLGINYGGRDEILIAINNILKDKLEKIDFDTFKNYLFTSNIPDPDLIVRTSGEQRISNFMLYQMAYSEFLFVDTYWPDFGYKDVEKCIIEYQNRDRKFGALK